MRVCKTKMNLGFSIFTIFLMAFGTTAAMADELEVDLCADQNLPVGTVTVSNSGTDLTVTYDTTGGDWRLVETHLAVGDELSDIPQTKKKNPKPGQFADSNEWDEPQQTVTYIVDVTGFSSPIYIAAHAKVAEIGNPTATYVVSGDGETMVTRRRAGNAGSFTTVNAPAVLAWEPSDYPVEPTEEDPTPSVWDNGIDNTDLLTAGADWIWESTLVLDPCFGTVITLQRTFSIEDYVVSGNLLITCDNGYEAFVDTDSVGSAQVSGDWKTSDLFQSFVNTSDWQSVEEYDVSMYLQSGENVLTIDAVNEHLDDDDPPNPDIFAVPRAGVTPEGWNPGACIFALEIESAREETAWGDGCEGHQFNESANEKQKRNWATYFTYTLQLLRN
jgi:hypothetical protein